MPVCYMKIDKVNHITKHNPVNQITDSARQYQRKPDNITGHQHRVVLPIVIQIKYKKNNRDNRNNNKHNAVIFEQPKGNPRVVDKRHMNNIWNDRQRFTQ